MKLSPSIFGADHPYVDMSEELRREDGKLPTTIIIGVQDGGCKPIALMLPHQLYAERLEALQKKYGEVYVHPIYEEGFFNAWTQIELEKTA